MFNNIIKNVVKASVIVSDKVVANTPKYAEHIKHAAHKGAIKSKDLASRVTTEAKLAYYTGKAEARRK